ncbi:MAG: PP2C family protein-serine/threonine phosphatase [Ignavibacteriaceae bacterium]|nr:PP2C family protein-serine/threonine phosphatase [Ignavibacteriaceae bacterium]
MNTTNNNKNPDPKLRHTIREDFRKIDFRKDLHREYSGLSEFYLDSEKRKRLESLPVFKRWLYQAGWLLKSMFLHLTPIRRVLVLVGVFFLFIGRSITVDHTTISMNESLLGGVLILFVLFLELKDKLMAKHELEAGRKVQQALMPKQNPDFPGWSIWLFSRPANEVGGDLVDYLRIDETKAGLTMADIAGKGLHAALLTSKLQATVRALSTDNITLSELGHKTNKIFHRDSLPNLFASMLYVQIQANSNKIEYINAGHFPPLIINNKEITEFEKGDAALGLIPDTSFTNKTIELGKDELFIAYSDGVFEAVNDRGEFFGIERFYQLVKYYSNQNPDEMGKSIITQLEQFIGNNIAADDISLIIMKRKS